jgi:hypothetical protein
MLVDWGSWMRPVQGRARLETESCSRRAPKRPRDGQFTICETIPNPRLKYPATPVWTSVITRLNLASLATHLEYLTGRVSDARPPLLTPFQSSTAWDGGRFFPVGAFRSRPPTTQPHSPSAAQDCKLLSRVQAELASDDARTPSMNCTPSQPSSTVGTSRDRRSG